MATWATTGDAQLLWADAPDDGALLQALLDAAQEVAEVYAPALPDGAEVPTRYTQAVVMQAREIWQAVEREGDVLALDGDYAIRVRPLSASVKSLLRPPTGRPRLWATPESA